MENPMFSKKWFLLSAFLLVLIFFISSTVNVAAQGNLLITPKRVVFDGTKKSYALNLANTGQDTARYIISLIHNRMKDDGSFERINQPDSSEKFADKYLSFYPRSVVLAPNEAQTVRIQIKKFDELQPGEYRSNLYFRAIPNEQPLGEKEPVKDSGVSIKLVPVFGISLPVIIQVGESTAAVNFSNVSVQMEKDTIPILKATFNRTGNMSVYGDISVVHISSLGKVTRVGVAKGVAVYSPNSIRYLNLRLSTNQGINYQIGKLQIIYADQSLNAATLAKTEIALQ